MAATTRGASRRRYVFLIAAIALAAALISTQVCLRVGFAAGLWLRQCPDGELRQAVTVQASGLTRGAARPITVSAAALYTVGPADQRQTAALSSFASEVALVANGVETPLTPTHGWTTNGGLATAQVALPMVNDGHYLLRTRVTSTIGQTTLDLPLPLFTPARVHVLTDRPLYEPGNTVSFRALVLKASDLTPLEERPGTWQVVDPGGDVLLEEKAPSGPWGVVAGSFPLDRSATSGQWSVTWRSGAVVERRGFTVKPFTLPRFKLEAATVKPFYRAGERPVLKGTVRYSSGAPVPAAKVQLAWAASGEWPPPTNWVEGSGLPALAVTAPNGGFVVELPPVPEDLRGTALLSASLSVVDQTGDRVEGSAVVSLSADPIAVTAVTELAGGLVEGFNNRLFLRATTADGRVLDGVTLNVKRLWEAADRGVDAPTDEDAVASVQLDPGPAVNVIIPAMPFRPPPPVQPLTRNGLSNLLASEEGDGDVRLADRMTFDRVEPRLGGCARYVHSAGEQVMVGLLVRASGDQGYTSAPRDRLGQCVATALREVKFEPGPERFFNVVWAFDDSDLPHFEVNVAGVPTTPETVETALTDALLGARDCLPPTVRSGALPRLLQWRRSSDGRSLEVTWVPVPGAIFADAALACITSRIGTLTLPTEPSDDEANAATPVVGIARVSVSAPEKYEAQRPQETVMVGYEFLVTARRGQELLGSTRLRLSPGAVPNIRLRASQQLVDPGAEVEVELLRGPTFEGELPEKLYLRHAWASVEAKVDKEARKARFTVPVTWQGWAAVEWNGGQVFFFVRPTAPLQVTLTPEKPRYAPGQVAQLAVQTQLGGKGGAAAVGLWGVDDSLGQLATLPGADELAGVRQQPAGTSDFGGIDAQALSLGRIRGANAAAATLMRLSALPPPPQVEAAVALSGQTTFDPNEVLVDRFYVVLGELSTRVRDWEHAAPAAEKMSNVTMARLWRESLTGLEQRQDSARDAWGRLLRLHRLPADLLALTEPRLLVVNGTRLPEDIQNWSQWVAKEKP